LRIYISGPMRGIKSFNMPAFNAADDALQAAGHETFNPARVDEAHGFDLMICDGTEDLTSLGFNLRNVLGADLAWLTKHADGVAYLPGSFGSKGAMAEMSMARALSLPVEKVEYWTGPEPWKGQALLDAFMKSMTAYSEDLASVTKMPVSYFNWDAKIPESVTEEVRAVDESYRPPGWNAEAEGPWQQAINAKYGESGTDEERVTSERESVLREAIGLIAGDRNASYGPPTQDFARTAAALTATGYRRASPDENILPLQPHDVAILMMMVKISRLMATPDKRDSWVDIAGYAGCGAECAIEEGK
jgi:Domain of unknown function (DUF6378)/Domain of unknown function (DUF4406)